MSSSSYCLRLLLPLAVIAGVTGCVESQPVDHKKPFEVEQLDSCLLIAIDMSISFADQRRNEAHRLCLSIMDLYFNDVLGQESRVVIAQISASDKVVLFEGTPAELRQKFKTPEEFNAFLLQNSSPGGSGVYQATRKAIEYVNDMPEVGDQTKLFTVILSDMVDSGTNKQRREAGRKMLETLKRYHKKNGTLALYYVSRGETDRWRKIMKKAGFESGEYVIENTIVENPQLPNFE